jgi:16S rRNA C967 or C1407 C5-methylase (RsmB/RsmF family)
VLLDAPCSGEGMQYKSDFKIFSWNEKEVRKIANLQQELLIS